MKNREKYKDELIRACNVGRVKTFYNEHVRPYFKIGTSTNLLSTENIVALIALWLDEEYIEPKSETDWSKVAVDTPILVKNCEDADWEKRYFAGSKDGFVCAWSDGRTSWNETVKIEWNFAKLAEVE